MQGCFDELSFPQQTIRLLNAFHNTTSMPVAKGIGYSAMSGPLSAWDILTLVCSVLTVTLQVPSGW